MFSESSCPKVVLLLDIQYININMTILIIDMTGSVSFCSMLYLAIQYAIKMRILSYTNRIQNYVTYNTRYKLIVIKRVYLFDIYICYSFFLV